jgi:hypothetical protein
MNKLAIVHLYCNGFSDEDLLDVKLMLSNPSTIAQQQKLELYKSRFEAASAALGVTGVVDRLWVQKNILRFTEEEIKAIQSGLRHDKVSDLEIEATQITAPEGPENPVAGAPQFDGGNVELGGGGIDLGALSEQQSIEDDEFPIRVQKLIELNVEGLDEDEDEDDRDNSSSLRTGNNSSLKVRKRDDPVDAGMSKLKYDLKAATQAPKAPSAKDLLESGEDFNIEDYLDEQIVVNATMNNTLKSTLQRFDNTYGTQQRNVKNSIIISENNSSGEDTDET